MSLPAPPPRRPNVLFALVGLFTGLRHGLIPLASTNGGWGAVVEVVAAVSGAGLIVTWWLETRRYRAWEKTNEPEPSARPDWA